MIPDKVWTIGGNPWVQVEKKTRAAMEERERKREAMAAVEAANREARQLAAKVKK